MDEFEKDINKVDEKNNKELIDPMIVDDDETTAAKKKTWDMIFLLCPEQAEALIKAYNEKGPEGLSKAKLIIAYENPSETPA